MQFIGLDIGTSFVKGAVLDLDRLTLEHVRRVPFPARLPNLPVLFHEVDPDQLLATVQGLIAELATHCGQCGGLVMCGQMHGLILVDQAGKPLTNIITWQDQRSLLPHPSGQGTYYDVLRGSITELEVRRMGSGLRAGLPLGTLFWMVEEARLDALSSDHAPVVVTLLDFVSARLCRDADLCVEPTNAAAHGMFNLETYQWHGEVLEKLGLARLQFPPVCSPNQEVGVTEIDGLRIPCFAPVGDHQCALLGTLLQENELSLNISTGAQISRMTTELCLGDYETRPYFDGCYLNTVAQLPDGRSLNALVQLLTELATAEKVELCDPWGSISSAVDAVAETDLQVDLGFHVGAALGHGQISQMREDNLTVGHLFRAALENMANAYFTHAQRLQGPTARDCPCDRLVFSGGLVQKLDPLRDTIVRRFGCDSRIAAEQEDTLLGLLILALVASGRINSVAEATRRIRQS